MAVGQAPDSSNKTMPWNMQETFRLLKNAPGTVYQECDEINRQIYRDWVRSLLRTSVAVVKFTKNDGTLREMRCTLQFDQIPLEKVPATAQGSPGLLDETKVRKPNDEVCSAFDLDKQEWRSFRYDRIKGITVDIGLTN